MNIRYPLYEGVYRILTVYERWYGGDHGGLHRVYVAEIVDAWVKE